MKIVRVVAINILIFSFLLLVAELLLRVYVNYDPAYYTGIKATGRCLEYPYGTVCHNSLGYPDDEFDTNSGKMRIGYFGDSVCYGVGVGQHGRISDLLQEYYTGYEHWNFCAIGSGLNSISEIFSIVRKFQLSKVIYLMNLNDIAPAVSEDPDPAINNSHDGVRNITGIKKLESHIGPWLRGKSYLYTSIRNTIKEFLTKRGYEASGYQMIELYPKKNSELLEKFSTILQEVGASLAGNGIEFIVVLLPYEMQVSKDASQVYRKIGIRWEDGFLYGSTQEMLERHLSGNYVKSFNAYHAFDGARDTAKIGEYFVYDKGDKIDWNHPTAKGHRLIAQYLISNNVLDSSDQADRTAGARDAGAFGGTGGRQ